MNMDDAKANAGAAYVIHLAIKDGTNLGPLQTAAKDFLELMISVV